METISNYKYISDWQILGCQVPDTDTSQENERSEDEEYFFYNFSGQNYHEMQMEKREWELISGSVYHPGSWFKTHYYDMTAGIWGSAPDVPGAGLDTETYKVYENYKILQSTDCVGL